MIDYTDLWKFENFELYIHKPTNSLILDGGNNYVELDNEARLALIKALESRGIDESC